MIVLLDDELYKSIDFIKPLNAKDNIRRIKAIRILQKEIEDLSHRDIDWFDHHKSTTIINRNIKTISGIKRGLMEGNIRLVISGTKKALSSNSYTYNSNVISFSDMLNESMVILSRAIDNFDPDKISPRTGKTIQFSTFVYRSIINSLRGVLTDQHLILRRGQQAPLAVISNACKRLSVKGIHEPSLEDIINELDETGPKSKRGKWSVRQLETAKRCRDVQRGTNVNKSGDDTVRFNIDDISIDYDQSEELTKRQWIKNTIANLDIVLNKREKMVIELRFGLAGSEPYSLEKVGQMFSLTKERIRQIEVAALKKLKEGIDVNIQ